MREGPSLILALAIIVSGQSVKNVKTGPCFKFKVTNGDNVTKIDLEHDEGSTIEASADSCNGRRILNISILASGVRGGIMGAYSEAPVKRHPDYELFPGLGYYRLHPVALNWESAQAVCKAEGADLAVINSDAEKNVAVALLKRGIAFSGAVWSDWVWIGLKRDVGGEIKTVFGDPLSKAGYAEWNEGAPKNYGDCVLIHKNGVLEDQNCAKLGAYICEQPL